MVPASSGQGTGCVLEEWCCTLEGTGLSCCKVLFVKLLKPPSSCVEMGGDFLLRYYYYYYFSPQDLVVEDTVPILGSENNPDTQAI